MFHLDYILYTIILFLLYVLIEKEINVKENFNHRGNEEIATKPNKKKGKSSLSSFGFFDLIYKFIGALYNFLLFFAHILISPFKFANDVSVYFIDSFIQAKLRIIWLYDGLIKLSLLIKDIIKDFLDTFGFDNYDFNLIFSNPVDFFKSLIR